MKISILHLSDIHFKAAPKSSRVDSIAATLNTFAGSKVIIIAVTGDIAFSGKVEEYAIAKAFFQELKTKIEDQHKGVSVQFAMVPGNHDCDFSGDQAVRNALLSAIRSGSVSREDSVVSVLTVPQNHFFEFASGFGSSPKTPHARLMHQVAINVEGRSIVLNCINTAWMSELDEQQGKLVAPIVSGTPVSKTDLSISLFHHPLNWIEADSARQFGAYIEANSDLILSGHEHIISHASQSRIGGEINEIISGGVLQQSETTKSEFNLIQLDLDKKEFRLSQYSWREDSYAISQSTTRALRRNVKLQEVGLAIDPDFQREFLDDPGINLTHSRSARVSLWDLFVYPDLKRMAPTTDPTQIEQIGDAGLVEELLRHRTVLIVGNEKSGKTTLAKRLFHDYYRRGIAPLILSGQRVNSCSEKKVEALIEKNVEAQYGKNALEKYSQLKAESRAIFIDDFRYVKLNAQGRTELLKFLSERSEHIVLFSDDLTPLGSLLVDTPDSYELLRAEMFQIKDMGHLRREQIIKKWVSIGREFTISDDELIRETNTIANGINTALLSNVVPSSPVIVLTILQMWESQTPLKSVQATYGYFYEMLITQALGNKTRWKGQEVDKLYTFLAVLAFHLFESGQKDLTVEKLRAVAEKYHASYAIDINIDETLRALCDCRILTQAGDAVSFRYKYLYFYFVARYLRDNIEDHESSAAIRTHVEKMAAEVFTEDYANILIFFSYLSKNPLIIDAILKNAKKLYAQYEWCDLATDVEFAVKGPLTAPDFAVEDKDVKTTRETELKRRDVAEEKISERARNDRMERQSQEMLDSNAAFKSLEIIGQIARNFSGSLKVGTKLQLTEECYALGLKSLRAWLTIIQTNLPVFERFIQEHLRSQGITEEEEIKKGTSELVFLTAQTLVFAFLKKISEAVGTEELGEIYSRILNDHPLKSVEMLNIAIKLDHFRHTPSREIIEFFENNEKSIFLSTLTRLFVCEHFYLFPVERSTRDRLCDKLKIAKNNALMLSDDKKKFKSANARKEQHVG